MHGAAVTIARQVAASHVAYDLILASDMMDVAAFRGLLLRQGITTPVATYFHENQIGYPVSPRDTDSTAGRDLHYGFINYTSALASGRVYFNSHYHKDSFLGALPSFLGRFPDHVDLESVAEIAAKAGVLPLGMDLSSLVAHRPQDETRNDKPLLPWNHRWEHDKNPDEFLRMVLALHERGLPFEVALLGERREEPELLGEARKRLGPAIVQDGPVEDFGGYARWLWRADILPVTSIHDFFGGSVVEAVYCGCHPVLPRRLAYPEHFPGEAVFYDSFSDALERLSALILSGAWREPCRLGGALARYDWRTLATLYDSVLASARD